MKKLAIIIYLFSIFYSCEKTLNVDVPDEGRRMVLNSKYFTDSLLTVNLSQSRHILDVQSTYPAIENANISLFENGKLVKTAVETDPGNYSFDYKIIAGNTYQIEASAANLGTITCESTAPMPVKIENIDLSTETKNLGTNASVNKVELNIQFNDESSKENFYMLQLGCTMYYGYSTDPNTGKIIWYRFIDPISFETNEPSTSFNAPLFNGYGKNAIIFDDAVFNGKKHNLKVYSEDIYISKSDLSVHNAAIYIYFRSISKELYYYYLSLKKYSDTEDNPFAEPVNVYSNIKNGFGIFGGSTMTIDSTVLKLDEVLKKQAVK